MNDPSFDPTEADDSTTTNGSGSSGSGSPASIQSDPDAVVGTANIAANSSAKSSPLPPKTRPVAADDPAVNPYIKLVSPAVPTPPATGVFFICRVNFETSQPDTSIQISGECRILQENPAVTSSLVIGTLDNRSEDDPDAAYIPRGESTSHAVNAVAPGRHFIEFNFVNDDAGAAVPMTQCFGSLENYDPCKPTVIIDTETRTERCPPPYEHIEFSETWETVTVVPPTSECPECDDCPCECDEDNPTSLPLQAATGAVNEAQSDLNVNLFGVPVNISRDYSNKHHFDTENCYKIPCWKACKKDHGVEILVTIGSTANNRVAASCGSILSEVENKTIKGGRIVRDS
jgi:hypothetical protein